MLNAILSLHQAQSESSTATSSDMLAANEAMEYSYDIFLHTLMWAQGVEYDKKQHTQEVMDMLAGLCDELEAMPAVCGSDWLEARNRRVREVVQRYLAQEAFESGSPDYSATLQNADFADNKAGWTIETTGTANDCCEITLRNTWIDSETNKTLIVNNLRPSTYEKLYSTVSQSVDCLPNGTYTVEVKAVSDESIGAEGWCILAIPDSDVSAVRLCRVTCPVTINDDGGASRSFYVYGTVWKEACNLLDYGGEGDTKEAESVIAVNGGKGRGWNYYRFDVEVKNHRLAVGATNDYYSIIGRRDTDGNLCSRATGRYLRLDDFRIKLKELGDNTDWSPILAVNDVEAAQPEVRRTYYVSLGGVMSTAQPPGVSVKVSVMSDGTMRRVKVLK